MFHGYMSKKKEYRYGFVYTVGYILMGITVALSLKHDQDKAVLLVMFLGIWLFAHDIKNIIGKRDNI